MSRPLMDFVTAVSIVVLPIMAIIGVVMFYKAMRLRSQLKERQRGLARPSPS